MKAQSLCHKYNRESQKLRKVMLLQPSLMIPVSKDDSLPFWMECTKDTNLFKGIFSTLNAHYSVVGHFCDTQECRLHLCNTQIAIFCLWEKTKFCSLTSSLFRWMLCDCGKKNQNHCQLFANTCGITWEKNYYMQHSVYFSNVLCIILLY